MTVKNQKENPDSAGVVHFDKERRRILRDDKIVDFWQPKFFTFQQTDAQPVRIRYPERSLQSNIHGNAT